MRDVFELLKWNNLRVAVVVFVLLLFARQASAADLPEKPSKFEYPAARRGDQVDDYHGTKVADPYRWLEDVDSEETRDWVKAQNRLTNSFLHKIPARDSIRRRLTQLWNYPKYGIPVQYGDRFFFTKNDGLQNQPVLYWSALLDGEPHVLLDVNKFSDNGTIALANFPISEDGRKVAYSLASAGSDWHEIHVRDVDSGKDLPDVIKWVKSSIPSWTHDNAGFFYSRYSEPREETKLVEANYFQKLYYHKLGTTQAEDRLVYDRADEKEWEFDGAVSDDGKFLVITVERGTEQKNAVFYQRLDQQDAKVIELLKDFDAHYEFLGNNGDEFWFRTDAGGPRYRIVAININHPEREHWREIVAESSDALLHTSVIAERFFLSYLHDAHSLVKVYDLAGHFERDVDLPEMGTVSFDGRRKDRNVFFDFTSFASPPTIYRYDVETGKSFVHRRPILDFDPGDYQTRQVFYTSRDGTHVPMFLAAKKGLKIDEHTPTLLYGYGGFNIYLSPRFAVSNLVWMEMGGVYAMPNLRGGGEYGREWHEAGIKLKKQNVFDDFIAAAQWLIDQKQTSTPKLAIAGRSNGGLLVGACLTQRPDLFGATLPGVGVMDMLRFHKFTVGWGWVSDYGSSDNPEEFAALRAYSPLHNIKPGTSYPPTLITTADHDDRVVPGHSFKFAAALQAAQAGPAPILIRIETQAGHGAGKPTTKVIEDYADQLAFLVDVLKIKISGNP